LTHRREENGWWVFYFHFGNLIVVEARAKKLGGKRDMRLMELLPNHLIPESHTDLTVFGVTDDSREVRFGFVFCALPLSSGRGPQYCAQAAARGAQVVIVPEGTPDEAIGLSEFEKTKVLVLRHPKVQSLYAQLVSRFHSGRPGTLAAVTGTNGKSSTVSFIRDLWTHAGYQARSLGTLGLRSTGALHTNVESSFTTFDAKSTHLITSSLAPHVSHVALEASSHGLEQGRLDGLEFDAAAFTNLTQDHLDYHHTMEAYFAAKLLLFTERLKPNGTAVVNADDERSEKIVREVRSRGAKLITFSRSGACADLRLLWRSANEHGQTLVLSLFGQSYEIEAPVAGAFQAENILAAIGVAVATGVDVKVAVQGTERIESVPGRLERAALLKNGAAVYVDFAHTPDALRNVLQSLRPHVRRGSRLHVVFGCGGDRDATKRPVMGQIASEQADVVFVTDDNPRTESPEEIRRAILAAVPGARDAGDRRNAIGLAISELNPGDILVVAGKGHEDYQILPVLGESGDPAVGQDGKIITHKIPFSDAQVVREFAGALDLAREERGVLTAA
jgi:UDP-N-acetylmuramoyl-L-alanyl-D-glutamate--2,6-diaminopimelate ligase